MIYSIDKRFEKFEGIGELKFPERFNEKLIDDFSNRGPGKLIFLIPEELLYETFVLSKFPKYILREYAMIKLGDDNNLGIEQYNLIKFKEDINLYEESDNKDEIIARTRQVIVDGIKDKKLDRQVIEKNFAIYFHSQINSEWIRSKYEYWYNENKAIIKLQPSQLKLDIILNRNEDVFLRGPVEAICEYRKSTPIGETVDAILWNDKVKNLTPDYDEESDDYGTEEYLDYKLTLTSDRLTRIFKILDNTDVTKEDLLAEVIENNSHTLKDHLVNCKDEEGKGFPFDTIWWANLYVSDIRSLLDYKLKLLQDKIEEELKLWDRIRDDSIRSDILTRKPKYSKDDLEVAENIISDYFTEYLQGILDEFISDLIDDKDPDPEKYKGYYDRLNLELDFNRFMCDSKNRSNILRT